MDSRLATALEGRYNVDREIGAGGMATVYLARDVKHNRNVALKVLNPELGAVLGVERFLSEIQVTANLQHPNLLPLFDSGEADGLLFYVMPYVEGESLRARLQREKQLPVDEAIRIAVSIANALEYAHGNNVIHRDLKPENILMQAGQAVIADFGIALAVSKAGGARVTQTGLSLGTPQYMSPEQATGDRVVDGRTDIYSLAAVLYEMLVGDPPHSASTAQAIIAKVLTERPRSVRASRPNVPLHVDAAIARALEKLAADRFATAREFAHALQTEGRVDSAAVASEHGARASGMSRAREVAAWTLAAVALAGFAWQRLQTQPATEAPVIRAPLDPPTGTRIFESLPGTTIAVSARGDMVAFGASSGTAYGLYVRRADELAARRIVENVAARNIVFSPDGKWIAFTEGTVLRKIAVAGGDPTTLATQLGTTVPYGLVWTRSDTLIVGSFNGLFAIPASGGASRGVPHPDSASKFIGQRWPVLTPNEDALIYMPTNSAAASASFAAISLRTGKITAIDVAGTVPLGVIDDHLVYATNAGTLWAVPFDTRALRTTGEPQPMVENLVVDPTGGIKASLSPSGTLAYLSGKSDNQGVLVAAGAAAGTPLLSELRQYSTPRYSPDGKRVAVAVIGVASSDIWVYDIARNTFSRLTTEGDNMRPEWTPDGTRIVFRSTRRDKSAIYWQAADGSGQAELLYQPDEEPTEVVVSPDNAWLVYRTGPGGKMSRDILAVPLKGERKVVPVATGPQSEMMPRFSPDGKWLAYQSNESGRFEVYVKPFPGQGARIPISDAGGNEPVWSRSGRLLYYRRPTGEVVEVAVTTGASLTVGARHVVVSGEYLNDASHASYDVAPDERLLMLKRAGAEARPIIVYNWSRELREKTAPKR